MNRLCRTGCAYRTVDAERFRRRFCTCICLYYNLYYMFCKEKFLFNLYFFFTSIKYNIYFMHIRGYFLYFFYFCVFCICIMWIILVILFLLISIVFFSFHFLFCFYTNLNCSLCCFYYFSFLFNLFIYFFYALCYVYSFS